LDRIQRRAQRLKVISLDRDASNFVGGEEADVTAVGGKERVNCALCAWYRLWLVEPVERAAMETADAVRLGDEYEPPSVRCESQERAVESERGRACAEWRCCGKIDDAAGYGRGSVAFVRDARQI
jgi:hypothetical protein